jgi:hypothetical protein
MFANAEDMTSSQTPISQLLIETDILADYLLAPPGEATLLRTALRQVRCYTTMLNALELFRAASDAFEREAILAVLTLVRVLGFPARTAETAALALFEANVLNKSSASVHIQTRESIVLGLAHASKLGILTRTYNTRYRQLGIVPIYDTLSPEPSMHHQSFSVTSANTFA